MYTDKTPKKYQCAGIGCPTVLESDDHLIIVGVNVTSEEAEHLNGRIGKRETAVKIPKDLLKNL